MKHKFRIITGPCSFKDGWMCESTAQQLIHIHASLEDDQNIEFVYRASLWKPRTNPGGFEGVGASAIRRFSQYEYRYGMPVATEVYDKTSIELCHAAGIRHIWIGARTVCDPFAMAEIAKAIENKDFDSIGIKNPPCKDVDLWAGAINRINRVVPEPDCVYAIFRGIKTSSLGLYRNYPDYSMLIELREKLPDIPIVLDPSHICGNADLISEFTLQAFKIFEFDGVMIESSSKIEDCLTDKQQHISPEEVGLIVKHLLTKATQDSNESIDLDEKLKYDRINIRELDEKMFAYMQQYIENREFFEKRIAKIKQSAGLPIFVPGQYSKIKNHYIEKFEDKLPRELIITLFETIHNESLITQSKVK